MQQLEEVVLRLAVAARIADQALGQSGVLDAVFLLAGFPERATTPSIQSRDETVFPNRRNRPETEC
jgi:hypothetical protein